MLKERDILNLSVLSLIKDGFNQSREMRDKLGIKVASRFNSIVIDMPHRYITKRAGKYKTSSNTYTLTKVGKEFVAKNESEVDYEFLTKHCNEWKPKPYNKPKLPQPKTSKKAQSAIEGISDLINTNNEYLRVLESIYSQIGTMLKVADDKPED